MKLRYALIGRGAFDMVFAAWLWLYAAGDQGGLPGHVGIFALCDGLIGVALASMLFRDARGQWLALLALTDGLFRVVTGAILVSHPDLQAYPLLDALFSTGVIVGFLLLGIAGVALVALRGRLGAGKTGAPAMGAVPALIASACAVLFSIGLMSGSADGLHRSAILAAFALATGLTFMVAGIRRGSAVPDFAERKT